MSIDKRGKFGNPAHGHAARHARRTAEGKGDSIKWPALYDHLRAKGHSKRKAAMISNGLWRKRRGKAPKSVPGTKGLVGKGGQLPSSDMLHTDKPIARLNMAMDRKKKKKKKKKDDEVNVDIEMAKSEFSLSGKKADDPDGDDDDDDVHFDTLDKSTRSKLRMIRALTARAKFDESKHKRDLSGRFADKPGDGGKPGGGARSAVGRISEASARRNQSLGILADARAAAKPNTKTRRTLDREIARRNSDLLGVRVRTSGGKKDVVPDRTSVSTSQSRSVPDRTSNTLKLDAPTSIDAVLADKDRYSTTVMMGSSNEGGVWFATDNKSGKKFVMKRLPPTTEETEFEVLTNDDDSQVVAGFIDEAITEKFVPELADQMGFDLIAPSVTINDEEVTIEHADDVVPDGWERVSDDAASVSLGQKQVDLADLVEHGKKFDEEGRKSLVELHILDWVTNQTDRHTGNFLEYTDGDGHRRVVPIDNGAAFDSFNGDYDFEPMSASYEDWARMDKSLSLRGMIEGAYEGDVDAFSRDLSEIIDKVSFDPSNEQTFSGLPDHFTESVQAYLEERASVLKEDFDDMIGLFESFSSELS